ncbi:hypothetical protein D9M72_305350 [compost metagenome]
MQPGICVGGGVFHLLPLLLKLLLHAHRLRPLLFDQRGVVLGWHLGGGFWAEDLRGLLARSLPGRLIPDAVHDLARNLVILQMLLNLELHRLQPGLLLLRLELQGVLRWLHKTSLVVGARKPFGRGSLRNPALLGVVLHALAKLGKLQASKLALHALVVYLPLRKKRRDALADVQDD